ncbi:MAG TPA: APC family permease [Ktedonobacterales bacterium]|nr:APC family permease [Ktedonobacterales bacterium]
MAQNVSSSVAPASAHEAASGGHTGNRLGAFLCWAVVFADIGTSVYYVPGILFRTSGIGDLAGLFVTLTLVAFVLLTLKYAEVSVRFPEGGGVVTVSARGINPWAGAVGGMFILVDYFLTSAISSLSGVQYFETLVPALRPIAVQLIVTLILLVLLGVLNWWGIKESATVSAVFALAAFASDIAILVFVFAKVPVSVISQAFHVMFVGEHLTGPVLLTGFAGAFLAFSGLESISQLSPVMKIPRKRTVTVALGIVAITVGITSPLLTFFSTTLLDPAHPELLRQTALSTPGRIDPNQFISLLGYAGGGRILQVLTAITASALLIFASNTAIIGAYHVFLALSRMQFFPQVVEKMNAFRGTPHVSIMLATGIPMAVLIAVGGRIDILGDMYAFGLLGAFSMTCIALDVLRFRERRGELVARVHPEEEEEVAHLNGALYAARMAELRARVPISVSPEMRERLQLIRTQAARGQLYIARIGRRAEPALMRVRGLWPDLRYYLGFLTTVLVVVAWVTNLVAKPLATEFGGGLTVLGVGIAVINYRRRQRMGETPIFPMAILRYIPNSRLVVLTGEALHNAAVTRAAIESADGHTLVFVYLGKPRVSELQPMAINDPYFRDDGAKRTFSRAAADASRAGVGAQFIYRIGGHGAVLDVWRVVRPDEIIAEARSGKPLSTSVAPEYVRFQTVDGVKVAHYVRHRAAAPARAEEGAEAPPARPIPSTPERPETTDQGNGPHPPPRVPIPKKITGIPSAGAGRTPSAAGPIPPRDDRKTNESGNVPDQHSEAGASPSGDIDDYVWTGTQLVRKSEIEAEPPPESDGSDTES